MALQKGQFRHVLVTLWPPEGTPDHEVGLLLSQNLLNYRYFVGQLEDCPDTGKLHAHVYIEFAQSYRLRTVVKMLLWEGFKPPHVEARRNSRTAARDYAGGFGKHLAKRKTNTNRITEGEWRPDSKGSKRKAELQTCAELIEAGWTADRIAWERPGLYLKHGNRIEGCIHARSIYQTKSGFYDDDNGGTKEEE